MLEELNNHLMQLQEQVQEGYKIRRRLEAAEKSYMELQKRLCEFREQLEKEKSDVDKLEGMNLTNLFYSILGTREERLEKERQEYLAAKLKYDQCQDELDALGKEIQDLKLQLGEINVLEREYQDLLRQKEKVLEGIHDATSRELEKLSEKLAEARAKAKEIMEALEAANAAIDGLERVLSCLNSASGWGTWDIIGGGILSTAIKHSYIDGAKTAVSQVQYQLRRLERELMDVGSFQHLNIDIGSFATFADFFFDGLIADWVVQSRISQSRENAFRVLRQVENIKQRLERALEEAKNEIGQIEYERQELIRKA
ncbi:hypothetical protein KVG29_10030 [Caldicoprobacter algeriensis]|uniref:hypothetical protein n=1 Tax=Caldicoprobacter algeriensis TaxID=699281 RepID=UPI0020795746|nr:hypothetical protein [Caldicoprobacter algeriensis]MCM8901557.1 hypothetical protein [Caldicoprobacter algeriensis]